MSDGRTGEREPGEEGVAPEGARVPRDDFHVNVVPLPPAGGGATGASIGTLTAEEPSPEPAVVGDDAELWAIILAGGIGSRFWPLSTPERPKQVLALINERPLIAVTLGHLAPLIPPERVLVLTSADIADAIHAVVPDVPAGNMLIEPRPLGTAAALPGSVAGRVCRPVADPAVPMDVMRLEHPGGWFDVVIDVAVHAGGVHLGRSAIVSPAPDGGDGLSEGLPVREITRFVELRGHVYAQVQQAKLSAGT